MAHASATKLSTRGTLLTLATLLSAAFFALDLLQPRKSAHLYVSLKDESYLTIDNRTGAWSVRIGSVGGLDGFEMALTDTNQNVRKLRSKYFPFPINWYSDWDFLVQARSPYLFLATPRYFPAIVFAIWPAGCFIRRMRRRRQSERAGYWFTKPTFTTTLDSPSFRK